MSPASEVAGPAVRRAGPLFLLAALAILPRLPSASGGYVLDDPLLVERNPLLAPAEDPAALAAQVGELFRRPYWHPYPYRTGNYRPLALASFAADGFVLRHAAGLDPEAMAPARRFLNLVLHALNAILLLGLLRRLLGDRRAALLGAAFFAAHPIHGEVLGTVIGRTDLLATGLSLAALRAFLGGGPPARRGFIAGGAWLAALLCKESAAAVPLAALALLPLLPEGERPGRLRSALFPAVCALAGFLALRGLALGVSARWSDPGESGPGWTARFPSTVRALVWDAGAMLWPFGLSTMHPFPRPGAIPAADTILRLLLLAALAGSAIRAGRLPACALAAFYALALPASNLGISLGVERAPRFVYLPCAAAALLAGPVLSAAIAAGRLPRLGVLAAAGAALALAGHVPLRWSRQEALLRASLREEPAVGLLLVQRAEMDRLDRNLPLAPRLRRAERGFRRALRLDPGYPEALLGAGLCLVDLRDDAGARRALEAARDAFRARGRSADAALLWLRKLDERGPGG